MTKQKKPTKTKVAPPTGATKHAGGRPMSPNPRRHAHQVKLDDAENDELTGLREAMGEPGHPVAAAVVFRRLLAERVFWKTLGWPLAGDLRLSAGAHPCQVFLTTEEVERLEIHGRALAPRSKREPPIGQVVRVAAMAEVERAERLEEDAAMSAFDIEPAATSLGDVLAKVFRVDRSRVEMRGIVGVDGTTPTLRWEIALDGKAAPAEMDRLSDDIIAASRHLAEYKAMLAAETPP